jgi:hypothetical protein
VVGGGLCIEDSAVLPLKDDTDEEKAFAETAESTDIGACASRASSVAVREPLNSEDESNTPTPAGDTEPEWAGIEEVLATAVGTLPRVRIC